MLVALDAADARSGLLAGLRRRARRPVRRRLRPRAPPAPSSAVAPARVGRSASSSDAHRVDALLAPIGLLAAIAAADAPAAALLVLPLSRCSPSSPASARRAIAQTIELGRAYRGTALLLRDLLEDDDEYTGHHTEDVVELSVAVAERLGVDEDGHAATTELGALLHDIGKIAIPDAIINKPGPLDDEEWALMKTHTIEGQQMLDRVGGLLGSVGLVVRASHERFDGARLPGRPGRRARSRSPRGSSPPATPSTR